MNSKFNTNEPFQPYQFLGNVTGSPHTTIAQGSGGDGSLADLCVALHSRWPSAWSISQPSFPQLSTIPTIRILSGHQGTKDPLLLPFPSVYSACLLTLGLHPGGGRPAPTSLATHVSDVGPSSSHTPWPRKGELFPLKPCHPSHPCDQGAIGITRELAGNAASQAPPQTSWMGACVFISRAGESQAPLTSEEQKCFRCVPALSVLA